MSPTDPDVPALAAGVRRRDRGAIARALNLMDDRRPEAADAAADLLEALDPLLADGAARVGVTGAPGAGKSTLLDAVARGLRGRGDTLAIVAVDPSSRRSGGALLGDRVRMRAGARDEGVYVRSMAARDRLGGLADATYAGVAVLAAAFDWVFVETVGVGQSEAEVAPLADHLLFVAQPGAGDLLQFMKAGILEWPDVFVVNKADQGALAERSAAELRAGLGLGRTRDAGWTPPVLLASARDSTGIDAVLDALSAHRVHLAASGGTARRRAEGRRAFVLEALRHRYGSFGLDAVGGEKPVAARAESASEGGVLRLLRDLGAEIEAALRGDA